MAWFKLNSTETLDELIHMSNESPQLLFKHSTRCSISSVALNRIQQALRNINLYVLDVIANRELSNQVAQHFNVLHESPQILIIYNEGCIYTASHLNISADILGNQLKSLNKINN